MITKKTFYLEIIHIDCPIEDLQEQRGETRKGGFDIQASGPLPHKRGWGRIIAQRQIDPPATPGANTP